MLLKERRFSVLRSLDVSSGEGVAISGCLGASSRGKRAMERIKNSDGRVPKHPESEFLVKFIGRGWIEYQSRRGGEKWHPCLTLVGGSL